MTDKFDGMSDEELKTYMLAHRDEESFHAYMDRLSARPNRKYIDPKDPNWKSKIREAIESQLKMG